MTSANTSGLAASIEELVEAVAYRARALDDVTRHLKGPLGPSRHSLRAILEMAEKFANEIVDAANLEVGRAADDADRIQILTAYLSHCNSVLDLVEKYLAHGTRRELSAGLSSEVARALEELGLPDYEVVLAHGEASNFSTSWGDVGTGISAPLQAAGVVPQPMDVALFLIPRVEGAGVLWRPILLGHEVAHVAVARYDAVADLNLQSRFDFAAAGSIPNPQARPGADSAVVAAGLYDIAMSWAKELLCDAYAVRRYGPASAAALCEYLASIGPLDVPSTTHPPGWLRLNLIFDQLGTIASARLNAVLEPWRALVPHQHAYRDQWAEFLAQMFSGLAPEFERVVGTFPGPTYDLSQREPWIIDIASDLSSGLPGPDSNMTPQGPELATTADVINAGWLVRREGSNESLTRLSQKTIENIHFVERWLDHGGTIPDLSRTAGTPEAESQGEPNTSVPSSLSGAALIDRLNEVPGASRLVVRPLLHPVTDSGVDLRLGHRFIIFGRTGVSSFDPLDQDVDPRAIQNYLELGSGETFVLHPQEIVLGATLEYLVMPDDVTGQVITRSSYGRLGLLTATAVQVHGGFHGCLTLELVNLSTIPIVLTPGERITQLVLWSTAQGSVVRDNKYDCPIGPEFSRVRQDAEAQVLRSMRRSLP